MVTVGCVYVCMIELQGRITAVVGERDVVAHTLAVTVARSEAQEKVCNSFVSGVTEL